MFNINATQTNCEANRFIVLMNLCDTPGVFLRTQKLYFWVSTLEYSRSTGPHFDLIKFNSSTLYFASGLFPLCLKNNYSLFVPHAFPMRNGFLHRHVKKKSPWWYPLQLTVEEANWGQSEFDVLVSPSSSFVTVSSWSFPPRRVFISGTTSFFFSFFLNFTNVLDI